MEAVAPNSIESRQTRNGWIALAQMALLCGLCLVVFREELGLMWRTVRFDTEWSFVFATPVLILLLVIRRRHLLASQLTGGSFAGLVLLIITLALYALSFNYAYPRRLAIVASMGGVVLAAGGWRVLKLCLPMLLLLVISMPTGVRVFARIIIGPETWTMDAAEWTLDLIPGAQVILEGVDLSYIAGDHIGTIALGEHNRGASFFFAYLLIGIYLTFVRIRPWWQVAVMAIAALPVVLASNLLRVVFWGVVTIVGGFEPTSNVPRLVATAGSLLAAYGLFALLLGLLQATIVEEPAAGRKELSE